MANSNASPVSVASQWAPSWRAAWTWPAPRRVATWAALMVVGVAALATWRYGQLNERFDEEARTLHRTIAQRLGQHDAHLTNLAAIAQLDDPHHASFLAVSRAVQNFYPRITSIDLVRIAPPAEVLASTPRLAAQTPFNLADVQERAGHLVAGRAAMLDSPVGPGYALVKRMGTTPASALVLVIDAARLIEPDAPVQAGARAWVSDSRGTMYGGARPPEPRHLITWPRTLRFEQALSSASQPLQLVMTRHPSRAELLPMGWMVLLSATIMTLMWLQASLLRARRARRDAALQAQELRLAHAMRVNGLGEMASGIAHELTQPLTAILSQSQAGLRLIAQGADSAAVAPIFHANVRLARRSGEILERIRSYVSQREPTVIAVELNVLAAGVADLARADLAARGVVLDLALDPVAPMVRIDPIAAEQVLHNLLRNAAEALQRGMPQAPAGACIVMSTHKDRDGMVRVTVRDNGPGIGAEVLDRLFEPFFTTKPGGMGLGLSLCERLVEALGGRISVRSTPAMGSEFTVYLRAMPEEAGA